MRLSFLVASVSFASLAALVAACGSTDTAAEETADGGASSGSSGRRPGSTSGDPGSTSGDPGSSSGKDGGTTSSGGPAGTILKSGNAVVVDVTADGQVVYLAVNGTAGSLEAVPVAGGQQAVVDAAIDAQNDYFAVSGSVVGVWKAIAANGLGTFSFWTKATGAKPSVATGSVASLFAGSDDGSKVAFSVNGVAGANGPTNSDLAVTSTGTPVATAVLTGTTSTGQRINLAAQDCSPDIGFVGKRFFSAHCTGTAANVTNARLYTVADGATTPTRLDAANSSAGTIKALWIADKAGSKVFATESATTSKGLVFDVTKANGELATLDANVTRGAMTDDGSAVIYRTTADGVAGIRRANATATPAPITLVDAGDLLGFNTDKSKVLTSVVAPVNKLVDLRVADTTTPNQTPAVIVATSTTSPLGFTRGGTHVLYLTDASQTGNTLKAKPIAGGNEVVVAKDIGGFGRGPGGWVIVLDTPKQVSQDVSTFTLKMVDLTKGSTLAIVSDSVLSDIYVSGSKLVYTRLAQQAGGIYSVDMP